MKGATARRADGAAGNLLLGRFLKRTKFEEIFGPQFGSLRFELLFEFAHPRFEPVASGASR
jgi:hypothetical protein